MKYIASLITEREHERAFQRFAPNQKAAEAIAEDNLSNAGCVAGDRFEIVELRPIVVSTLVLMSYGKVDKVTP